MDAAAIALSAGVSVAFTRWLIRGSKGQPVVEITAPSGEWVLPLGGVRSLTVTGPLGDTVVAIDGESVGVHSSPCSNQICVRMGRISRTNQWIACLPNRVFVSINGGPGEDIDAYSF